MCPERNLRPVPPLLYPFGRHAMWSQSGCIGSRMICGWQFKTEVCMSYTSCCRRWEKKYKKRKRVACRCLFTSKWRNVRPTLGRVGFGGYVHRPPPSFSGCRKAGLHNCTRASCWVGFVGNDFVPDQASCPATARMVCHPRCCGPNLHLKRPWRLKRSSCHEIAFCV